jgi:murein L,D-transpeptidase YafK
MRISKLHIYFLFLIASCSAQERNYINYNHELSEVLKSLNLDSEKISVFIDKSEYKLALKIDTIVLKEYPVVFGKNPLDDKLMQGDKCSPEGTFNIVSKYPHKTWSKFIWINYPNDDSWKKHNSAKHDGIIPKDAKIGGEIGIHGVPKGMDNLVDLKINWTLGCISMKNKDVDEIYPYISESTIIVIQK